MSMTAMLPSSQRPIPLTGRNDLVVAVNDFQGVLYWVIKDPVGLKYHRLQAEQYQVLKLLDAERSLEQIRDELQKQFPTLHLTLSDVQNLITDLHKKGLVRGERRGQGASLLKQHKKERAQRLMKLFKNLLYLRLPGWDPETTLTWMYPYFRWMFHPVTVAFCMMFVVSSWLLLGTQFETFRGRLPEFQQFFGWPNLIYLWVTMGIAKIIHEFGHGLSCKHFGGECHEMGVMLLVFSPCLYCDVSDSWLLKNKWHRIMIAAAGMYIEIILSAIAVYVWWNTRPGMLHHLALNTFFVTTITTVIFNANPLMRFDGYYMMSDFLEIPNLRPKADKLLRESFAWYCLGIESRPDPFMPETGRAWFVIYAISAWLYRWVILFGITMFLYTVLKPYGLQSIGIALAVVSIAGILTGMVTNTYKIIAAPRIEPLSYPKVTATLLILTALIAGGLAIPIPWHLESAFLVEPLDAQAVYNNTPGQLAEFLVKPGEDVVEGQLLARLTNPELDDERRLLLNQIKVQEREIDLQKALDDLKQLQVAEEKMLSLNEKLESLENRIRDLEVVAPISGIVVAPPKTPKPDREQIEQALGQWYGSPLDDKNKGAFFAERTHLLSIAPRSEMEAILLVDQGDRNDLTEETSVELKFEHLPARTYHSQIADISERHVEFAPEPLTQKMGGDVATVTDQQGRERLTSIAYQATVELPDDPELMVPGLRGHARFLVDERTAGEWLWRYFRRTFHFRM